MITTVPYHSAHKVFRSLGGAKAASRSVDRSKSYHANKAILLAPIIQKSVTLEFDEDDEEALNKITQMKGKENRIKHYAEKWAKEEGYEDCVSSTREAFLGEELITLTDKENIEFYQVRLYVSRIITDIEQENDQLAHEVCQTEFRAKQKYNTEDPAEVVKQTLKKEKSDLVIKFKEMKGKLRQIEDGKVTIKDAYKKEKLYKADKQVMDKADHCISIGGSVYVSHTLALSHTLNILRTALRWQSLSMMKKVSGGQ